MNKNYKFSIIIAIYNMENYLMEAIDSLVNQTIGFEDNLQVLLVNDGSVDHSEQICKSYEEKYPLNVQYIYKENGGVSDARNKGLEYATGELVNFLDADDRLEIDALEKVYKFFEQNREEVDLISIPLYFFEGKEGEHVLNDKYTSTRVIDIFQEPKCLQMHISSSFIKLEEIKKYSFNKMLKLGEDAEVANKVILHKGKYGVVADTKYMYRKRNTASSAMQGARENKANYTPPLKYLYLELIQFALEKYSKVPKYLQWMIVYDLGGKIVVPYIKPTALSQAEIEEFLGYAKQILNYVDDEIILGRTDLRRYYNLYLLILKYEGFQRDKFQIISNKDDAVLCRNDHIVDLLYRQKLHVNQIKIQDNTIKLSGYFNFIFDQYDFKLIIESNGTEKEIIIKEDKNYQVSSLNQFVASGYCFTVEIPFDSNSQGCELKAKALLGKSKVQIKLLLAQDEFTMKEADGVVIGDYRFSSNSKVISVKKNSISLPKTPENISKQSTSNRDYILKPLKKYIKNRVIPSYVVKSSDASTRKTFSVMGLLNNKKLLNKIKKEIPANYKYYLTNYNYGKENEFKIATSVNQACLYNSKRLLLAKLTDTFIDIDKYKIDNNQLTLKGSIASPFKAESYHLKCYFNKQSTECELSLHSGKSIKLHGDYIIECSEFEVKIPLNGKIEIYFEMNIGLANVIPQILLNEAIFGKNAKKAGYDANIKDKKKIELFS